MIPDYALPNFEPKETDDKQTVMNKLFHLSRDKVMKKMLAEEEQKKLKEQQEDMNRKYNEIMKLKKDKSIKGQLELQAVVEEFLNEHK